MWVVQHCYAVLNAVQYTAAVQQCTPLQHYEERMRAEQAARRLHKLLVDATS